jgi:hypothetical protein
LTASMWAPKEGLEPKDCKYEAWVGPSHPDVVAFIFPM